MNIETVQFFEYNIRSTVIDNVRMYLVADLLNQYNKKNGKKRRFLKYLQNQQTLDLLLSKQKDTGEPNSVLQCQPCTKDTRGANLHLVCQHDTNTAKWNIDGVIKYITFSKTFSGAHSGYVICEELLIACLMWADSKFAWSVYTFLKDQRAKDNNFLQQTIQQLQAENNKLVETQKQMQNRHVHDEKEYQWTYVLTVTKDEVHNNVYLRSRYIHQPCKGKKTVRGSVYYLKNIPNGYELRYRAYDSLLNIVRRYGGDKKYHQRCTFYIPLDMWNIFTEEILADIHIVLKQIRQAAGWRTDLDYKYNDELDAILGLTDFKLGCGY